MTRPPPPLPTLSGLTSVGIHPQRNVSLIGSSSEPIEKMAVVSKSLNNCFGEESDEYIFNFDYPVLDVVV